MSLDLPCVASFMPQDPFLEDRAAAYTHSDIHESERADADLANAELEAESDEDELAGDDSEDDSDEDPAVLLLACEECGTTVSERGVQVVLVADPQSSLFSTDIPTEALREGDHRMIPTCDCYARTVHCAGCGSTVGYHVLRPCAVCGEAEHNGHYWLFDHGVTSSPREVTWSKLPYNGASPVDAEASGPAVETDDETCCICAASPMFRRTRVEGCAHEFCFGCISRECDARAACPLCRRRITRDMLVLSVSPV